ncbi:coniferyl alcohol acyltransferase-like [Nymphaea colorata]|nr:coniferyl alcohol acyltransferase-like [Nymphaea colorata]
MVHLTFNLKQVTELTCGGVVMSCTTDHRICDLYSTNMFLEAWAEMARTGTISVMPSFRRSLLSPRRPGLSSKLIDHETYVALPPSLPPAVSHVPSVGNQVSRIYLMRAQDMEKIQALASYHGARRSKLEALSGCLWKAVAKTASSGDTCKLGISVDGRSALIQDGGSRAAMDRYFGNVLSCPHGELDADELRKRPLSWVADRIHEFLETTTTKEYFLGLIDWFEASRPYPVLPKVFCRGRKDGLSLVVSHGRPFHVKKLDFGWGKPAVGSIYFPDDSCVGYVMPLPTPSENGDWVIFMNVFQHQLESIEAELGDVLHPLSVEHLN